MPERGKPWETRVRDRDVDTTVGLPCDGIHGEVRDGDGKGDPPRPWGGGSWGELGQMEPKGCSSCSMVHEQRGAAPQKRAQGECGTLEPSTLKSPQCNP